MRVPVMMLADHAQVADGKLFVNGGGWSNCTPQPFAYFIALKIEVPWAETDKQHSLQLVLHDGRGNVVTTPTGDPLARIDGQFRIDRPPGVLLGAPVDMPLAVPVPPLQLEPGQRYSWRLSINDESDLDWEMAFSTRTDTGPSQVAS